MDLMLASKFNEKRAQDLIYEHGFLFVQEKFDGARVYVKDGELYTRNHKHIIIPESDFKEQLMDGRFKNFIYDGELLALDDYGSVLPRQIGNGIINSAIKGNVGPEQKYRLVLFDCIFTDNPYVKYVDRYWTLVCARGKDVIMAPTERVDYMETIHKLYEEHIKQGHEGIMIKNPSNVYVGKRVTDIMKMKEEKTADLKVLGFVAGEGKYENMIGSLTCITEDNKLIVNVGSGLTDAQRTALPEFGTIIEVKYNQVIQDEHGNYSLFLPIFKGYRKDKDVANTLEELL